MDELTRRLSALSAAEEFLEFFGIRYDQAVVNVNRLHILKRFQQYLRQAKDLPAEDSIEQFRRYRELLSRAYGDFVRSTPAKEKVFKVLQQVEGQRVTLDALRANLHRDPRAKESPVTHPEAA
ncbi:MAG TPA: nitrogenase stabilizing/protective protein NifW [Burkholderiaceae bacterium]|nr:nitrogenase stabilizing/protective protein NifW [Burkholderiaceae bacterium]